MVQGSVAVMKLTGRAFLVVSCGVSGGEDAVAVAVCSQTSGDGKSRMLRR